MMQYRELDLHEALDAKIAGKELESSHSGEKWMKASQNMLSLNHKYRIEIEAPKHGDMVYIKDRDMSKWVGLPEELRGRIDGKYITMDSGNHYSAWDEIKPISEGKDDD